jgi:hypothetical protein
MEETGVANENGGWLTMCVSIVCRFPKVLFLSLRSTKLVVSRTYLVGPFVSSIEAPKKCSNFSNLRTWLWLFGHVERA